MNSNGQIKILFLAADPSDAARLRLGQELREIRERLQLAKERDRFVLEPRESVRPGDISQAIFDVEPQIVHFSGHGTGTGELCFEDLQGKYQPIQPEALAALFELVADQINCVVLNACHSQAQAKAIAEHIPFVIGMNQAIGDKAAIAFAVGFYKALAAKRTIDQAYKFGCVEIKLQGIAEHLTPVLYTKQNPASLVSEVQEIASNKIVDVKHHTYASLWLHGWVKQAYSNSPTVELDWTEHFDIDAQPRRIANQETWNNILLPSLVQARQKLTKENAELTIDIRGKFPLTAAVAIGHVFPDTRGYTLRVEQRTTGQSNFWRSDASPSDAKFKVVKESGETGEHLLIALGITGNPSLDVAQLLQDSAVPFSAVVYAEPESGIGERAIGSDADAVALVLDAKVLIRRYRYQYSASYTHLVLYAPVSFCLFLGQRLRVVGDVICYERVADRNYQPSVKLVTG